MTSKACLLLFYSNLDLCRNILLFLYGRLTGTEWFHTLGLLNFKILFVTLCGFFGQELISLACLHLCVCLSKRVDEDGQEEIEQNEVTYEDPWYVEESRYCLKYRWTFSRMYRSKQDTLPVFHREDLKDCDESNPEWFVILTWKFLIRSKFILALEDLAAQKRVNENEHENQDWNPDEVHESSLDYTDNHRHWLERA